MDKGGTLKFADADLPSADQKDNRRQVGAATLVAAASYGMAPLNVSFAKAAAIESEANFIKQLDGMENFISSASSGAFTAKSRFEREKEEDEKTFQLVASVLEEIEVQRQRERDEWAHTESTIGGVTMTGAQWSDFAKRLRSDEALRERMLEDYRKLGLSDDDARKRYERLTRIAAIAAIPPSHRTEEENDIYERAKNDPAISADTNRAVEMSGIQIGNGHASKLSADFSQASIGIEDSLADRSPSASNTAVPRVTTITGPVL